MDNRQIIVDAIAAVNTVDPRLGDAMKFMCEFPGVLHAVALSTTCEEVGNYEGHTQIYLSANYSAMSLVIASCILLKQAHVVIDSYPNADLGGASEAIDSAIDSLVLEFGVALKDEPRIRAQ